MPIMNQPLRVACLFAYVGIDEKGSEGIVAAHMPGTGWMPLVGADMDRMRSLEPYAIAVAKMNKRPVKLARFAVRTDLVTVDADGVVS